ncbi:MAG: hypothetical protein LAP87_15195 [Acidobacteriia bacterium]|nr:hypothetical protein [Terriglobia bacterium]
MEKRYLFQAHAIAASGHFTNPFEDLIPAQAATALPVEGGYGSARSEGFRYKEIFSFGTAYSEVVGTVNHKDGAREVLAITAIERVNILDAVTCDRVVARVASRYPADGSEPAIVPTGSRLEGLRVGDLVFNQLDFAMDVFSEYDTWSKLMGALGDGRARERLAPLMLPRPDGTPIPLPTGDPYPAMMGFSIVRGLGKAGEQRHLPFRVAVPHFGTVHLGDFFAFPTRRQVLMIRVELGSPVGGSAGIGGSGSGTDTNP